ncbi:Calcipressin-domain-containing protein [Kockovaella imperatae]|uniref:Calcipressin-domain-containing protein n=1 Tax=Kockovaella imperatae TaxID=4999 RepID=A0A1Y1UU34_9TREE|nr:Calcipressin-domain-containing protein [Kockovaella imperatae]ORX41137.1 Calcipressin-domain-containing protein [Kockovaella imperatae]
MNGSAQTQDIPSPPSLLSDVPDPSETNTHALILPHQSLFLPEILARLREHYEQYGSIAHWAPVRGFGRVIIVYDSVEGAERAKRQGDWLKLDVDLPAEESYDPTLDNVSPASSTGPNGLPEDGSGVMDIDENDFQRAEGSSSSPFKRGHRRRKSKGPTRGITLRLHPLPFTPLNPDPSTFHLAPPHAEKNFLISPPGSPPEGWEPVVEDAPNSSTLAEDLQRALEALQLKGKHRRRGSKEVILEEGGVRVEVEDCTLPKDDGTGSEDGRRTPVDGSWSTEERVTGGASLWAPPSQDSTPAGRVRIVPTAMPPRQGQ